MGTGISPPEDGVSLELARDDDDESKSRRRVCRTCGQPSERICTRCGIDLVTGDLVAAPEPDEVPQGGGARPERRRVVAEAVFAAIPTTNGELLKRGLIELSHGLGGSVLCLVLVVFALSFREIPVVREKIAWSGQLLATFILAFLLVEKARAAREGDGGLIGSSGAFDPSALGGSLLSAFMLLPILSGTFGSDPVVGLIAGIPFGLLLPALVGALACEGWEELTPWRLFPAIWRSPGYARTTVWVALSVSLGDGARLAARRLGTVARADRGAGRGPRRLARRASSQGRRDRAGGVVEPPTARVSPSCAPSPRRRSP